MICRAGRGAGLPREAWCDNEADKFDLFCPEHRAILDRVAATLRMRKNRPTVKPKAPEPQPPAASKISLDDGAAELARLVTDEGEMTRAQAAEIVGVPFTTLRHRAARAIERGWLYQTTTGLLTLEKPIDAYATVLAALREHGPMPRAEIVAATGLEAERVASVLVRGRREGVIAHAVAGEPVRLATVPEAVAA